MIGPTGVGKTEIARRLAALAGAPFVKVEATKYTEVGYVGRDVESMVRDLVEAAIRMVTDERRDDVANRGRPRRRAHHRRAASRRRGRPRPVAGQSVRRRARLDLRQLVRPQAQQPQPRTRHAAGSARRAARARQTRGEIERGFYDVRLIEIEVEETPSLPIGMIGGGMDQAAATSARCSADSCRSAERKKRVTVADARRIFAQEEAAKLIDMDAVKREALRRAGEDGIIFIDEIDKVAGSRQRAAAPTFRAKACSATSCRSSKAGR